MMFHGSYNYALHSDAGILAMRSFGIQIKDKGIHSLYILPQRQAADKRSFF
jgi:hypothetical protein